MKHQVAILDKALERLQLIKLPCAGNLYGIFSKNTIIVLGVQLDSNDINLSYSFPAEVDLCGIFDAHEDNSTINFTEKVQSVDVTDNPILFEIKLSAKNNIEANIIHNDKPEKIQYSTISEQELYSKFLYLRLKGQLPIKYELDCNSLKNAFDGVRKSISSGEIVFRLPNMHIFLMGKDGESNLIGLTDDPTISQIYEENNANEGSPKKKKGSTFELHIMDVNIIQKISCDTYNGNDTHAPIVILEKKPTAVVHLNVTIDSLCMIDHSRKFSTLYNNLIETMVKHLYLTESILMGKLQSSNLTELSIPETFHFYPDGVGHFISKIYFRGDTEDALLEQRKLLHEQLLLKMDAPKFRRNNQYHFKSNNDHNRPLINPHEGVKPTDNGGQVANVKGKYEYYHYCQNNMDDNGWGCAYRSLQTLASWFIIQGYTKPGSKVPTFNEIQKCLVDIGDKTSNFIGSRQWIGSTEVNFVLNTLLGVTSKILYVSSGDEMSLKGQELLYHFQTNGSPVMIGGGVLAHTILGVDYNQDTGNIKFLILDPHYTGGEDLHIVQSKGWCGWKSADFWNKTAYYNMCLPQVPREV